VTLKDKTEERGGEEEEGGKQGTPERKKTEGPGTSQGIQDRGLSHERDDDGDLSDESPVEEDQVEEEKEGRSRCECF
jgi:hypothetical protein